MKNLFFGICIIGLFTIACKEKPKAITNTGINKDSSFVLNSLLSHVSPEMAGYYSGGAIKSELFDSLPLRLKYAWKDTIGQYILWRVESLNRFGYLELMFYVKDTSGAQYFLFNKSEYFKGEHTIDLSSLNEFCSSIFKSKKVLSSNDKNLIKKLALITGFQIVYFFDYSVGYQQNNVHHYLNRGHSFMPDNYFLNCKNIREIKNEKDIDTLLSICRSSYLQIALPEANDFSDTFAYNEYLTKSLPKVNTYVTTKIVKEQRRILIDRCVYIQKQLKEIRSTLAKGNTYYFYSIPDLRLYKLEINQDSKNRIKLYGFWLDPIKKPKTIFFKDIPDPYSDEW